MIDRKQHNGFALGVVATVVAIVVIIGGLGYVYYTRTHQKSTTAATSVNAQPGTTGHVAQDITEETESESAAETSADSGAQQAAASVSSGASNVGGAYNENNL